MNAGSSSKEGGFRLKDRSFLGARDIEENK